MTNPIVSQPHIDANVARVLATYWLDKVRGSEEEPTMMNGDRILDAINAASNLDPNKKPEESMDEFCFAWGFNTGVESGFALALALLREPLGDCSNAIREALNVARKCVPEARGVIAQDRQMMQKRVALT